MRSASQGEMDHLVPCAIYPKSVIYKMIKEKVLQLLKEHGEEIRRFNIQKMFIFGSVARDEKTLYSDIDILIKFEGPASYDLYMELKFYLEGLLGRKVNLITEGALRSEIRQSVEKELIRVA